MGVTVRQVWCTLPVSRYERTGISVFITLAHAALIEVQPGADLFAILFGQRCGGRGRLPQRPGLLWSITNGPMRLIPVGFQHPGSRDAPPRLEPEEATRVASIPTTIRAVAAARRPQAALRGVWGANAGAGSSPFGCDPLSSRMR